MAHYEERLWPGDPSGQTRKDREPFRYRAYVPDPIAEAEFPASGPLAQAISDAERTVSELNHEPPALKALEAVARQLLRAESVASSRIEGLEMSHKRLARVAYVPDVRDETAASVLGNIRAMEEAIAIGSSADPISVDAIVKLHSTLMESTRDAHLAGVVRDKQNWIGGSTFSPREAEFVPPPPENVAALLEDLAAFVNRDDLPAVQQAALGHSQFETIHPFADGNGRVGRCLIHVVLRRRRLAPRYVPPISLVLAAHADSYIKGLTAFRDGRPNEWCLFFANTTAIASREAENFARKVAVLQKQWRQAAGVRRRDAAAALLIEKLPEQPVVDVKSTQAVIGGSEERARLALNRLKEAGVLEQVTVGRRNRVWEAVGLYDALNDFERDLATPDGSSDPALPRPALGRAPGTRPH
jgi:Fic family protein